jgi:pimeloyl-ACP methyl ester carboxylesterase
MPTVNGIFYAERGAGPPLVCVHGAGGSHRHWGGLLAALAPHARVLAVDLPGHGRSTPAGAISIPAYAEALGAFVDALGLERPLLAGHSMGAAVALELAVARPGRVGGLALVGAGARLRVAPTMLSGLAADPPAAIAQLVAWMFPEPVAHLREPAAADYLAAPEILRADMAACDGWDIRGRLAGLGLPALVVCGDADVMTPPKLAGELQELLGAELVTLSGVGHVPMVQAPDATAAAIAAWLSRV